MADNDQQQQQQQNIPSSAPWEDAGSHRLHRHMIPSSNNSNAGGPGSWRPSQRGPGSPRDRLRDREWDRDRLRDMDRHRDRSDWDRDPGDRDGPAERGDWDRNMDARFERGYDYRYERPHGVAASSAGGGGPPPPASGVAGGHVPYAPGYARYRDGDAQRAYERDMYAPRPGGAALPPRAPHPREYYGHRGRSPPRRLPDEYPPGPPPGPSMGMPPHGPYRSYPPPPYMHTGAHFDRRKAYMRGYGQVPHGSGVAPQRGVVTRPVSPPPPPPQAPTRMMSAELSPKIRPHSPPIQSVSSASVMHGNAEAVTGPVSMMHGESHGSRLETVNGAHGSRLDEESRRVDMDVDREPNAGPSVGYRSRAISPSAHGHRHGRPEVHYRIMGTSPPRHRPQMMAGVGRYGVGEGVIGGGRDEVVRGYMYGRGDEGGMSGRYAYARYGVRRYGVHEERGDVDDVYGRHGVYGGYGRRGYGYGYGPRMPMQGYGQRYGSVVGGEREERIVSQRPSLIRPQQVQAASAMQEEESDSESEEDREDEQEEQQEQEEEDREMEDDKEEKEEKDDGYDQEFIEEQIERVDNEIATCERMLAMVRAKKAAAIAASAMKTEEVAVDKMPDLLMDDYRKNKKEEDGGDAVERILRENRKMAKEFQKRSYQRNGHLSGCDVEKIVQLEKVVEEGEKSHVTLREHIVDHVKKKKKKKQEQDERLREEYEILDRRWKQYTNQLDRHVTASDHVTPSNNRRRSGFRSDVVRTEAEWQSALVYLMGDEEREAERVAKEVPMETDKMHFINRNHLVVDAAADLSEWNGHLEMKWSEEEKELFKAKMGVYGKDFVKISKCLPLKSTRDCVEYYYRKKVDESLKPDAKKRRRREEVSLNVYDIGNDLVLLRREEEDEEEEVVVKEKTSIPVASQQQPVVSQPQSVSQPPQQPQQPVVSQPVKEQPPKEQPQQKESHKETPPEEQLPKEQPQRKTVSYWSVSEKSDFLKALATHGANWDKLSKEIHSKSAIQVRNYFNNYRIKLNLDAILMQHNHPIPSTSRKQSSSEEHPAWKQEITPIPPLRIHLPSINSSSDVSQEVSNHMSHEHPSQAQPQQSSYRSSVSQPYVSQAQSPQPQQAVVSQAQQQPVSLPQQMQQPISQPQEMQQMQQIQHIPSYQQVPIQYPYQNNYYVYQPFPVASSASQIHQQVMHPHTMQPPSSSPSIYHHQPYPPSYPPQQMTQPHYSQEQIVLLPPPPPPLTNMSTNQPSSTQSTSSNNSNQSEDAPHSALSLSSIMD